MQKKNKIAVADSLGISSFRLKRNVNWEKSYIAQDDKSEKLTVLFEESAVGKSHGYNALEEYQKVEQLINKFNISSKTIPGVDNVSLDDGNSIAQTLFSRKASHHRPCHQKITLM